MLLLIQTDQTVPLKFKSLDKDCPEEIWRLLEQNSDLTQLTDRDGVSWLLVMYFFTSLEFGGRENIRSQERGDTGHHLIVEIQLYLEILLRDDNYMQ